MKESKSQETEFSPSTNRIEAFSDGVFAIVATLLVLELRVPELAANFTDTQSLEALWALGPKFAGFVFTFLALAIYWVNHHQLFHSIRSADRPTLWYNNALLFWLCFIPFPTAFIGEYPSRIVPVMMYGSVMTAAGISFNLLARHAVKAKLFRESISQTTLKKSMRRGMLGPIVYSISVFAAPLSTRISLVIFAVVPLLYFIPQKIVEEKQTDFHS